MENRISAIAVWLLALLVGFGLAKPSLLVAAIVPAVTLLFCNRGLYRLFYRRDGLIFSLGAIVLHRLHYLYTSATFALVVFRSWLFSALASAHYLRTEPAPALVVRD